MRGVHAFQIEPIPSDCLERDRRIPAIPSGLDAPPQPQGASLQWPASWPARLYAGASGVACRVRDLSGTGARLVMRDPPQEGTRVSLKFPFTVYMKGRVVWCQGEDLGIDFDEDAKRSVRIIEDMLLDTTGA